MGIRISDLGERRLLQLPTSRWRRWRFAPREEGGLGLGENCAHFVLQIFQQIQDAGQRVRPLCRCASSVRVDAMIAPFVVLFTSAYGHRKGRNESAARNRLVGCAWGGSYHGRRSCLEGWPKQRDELWLKGPHGSAEPQGQPGMDGNLGALVLLPLPCLAAFACLARNLPNTA